jgi:hypothetical protein
LRRERVSSRGRRILESPIMAARKRQRDPAVVIINPVFGRRAIETPGARSLKIGLPNQAHDTGGM